MNTETNRTKLAEAKVEISTVQPTHQSRYLSSAFTQLCKPGQCRFFPEAEATASSSPIGPL